MKFAEHFYVWALTIRVPARNANHLAIALSATGLLPEESNSVSHKGEVHSLMTLDLPTTVEATRVDALFRSQVTLFNGEIVSRVKIKRAGPVQSR